jgi:hypothetical protein
MTYELLHSCSLSMNRLKVFSWNLHSEDFFHFSDLSMQAPNISYLFDLIISGYLLVVYIQRLVYSFQFNAILQDGSLKMTLIP